MTASPPAQPDEQPDEQSAAAAEDLVQLASPAGPVRRDVDPEDWQRSGGSDDDRYLRERPPHW